MNLLLRSNIEDILARFEAGELTRHQAAWNILEMPQISDFEGIWELLIIHICLTELTFSFPQLKIFKPHRMSEIRAWQSRLKRFLQKPKPSFRNAIYKDFEAAKAQLLKNDGIKLFLNLEMHLEEIINADDMLILEQIEQLNLSEKEMAWFLDYQTS